jgi:N-acetylmuramoyl-L-alanine amidase
VLDPGHGGEDTGARAPGGVLEKTLVQDIARRVAQVLRASGVRVKLTRERDQSMGLQERAHRARRWDADVFVSIHLNSAANPAASGVETYVLPVAGQASTAGDKRRAEAASGNGYDTRNMLLAYRVHRALCKASPGMDRGIRRGRFEVLRLAPCPAALVECGFLSNPADRDRVASPEGRASLAAALAKGIAQYLAAARAVSRAP